MEIVSYNINGIRAAMKKGLADWLGSFKPDVVCLQEIKASPDQFDDAPFWELGYHCYWFPAEKKGYSGTAILSLEEPDDVKPGVGFPESDAEGRTLQIQLKGIHIINTYFPSGSSGLERQDFKMQFLDWYFNWIHSLDSEHIIHCGDFNICNKAIDIHDPVRNETSSGFLPEERAWMDQYFESGFVDTFRFFYPELADRYSWWSYRAGARRRNKGWRIDYITASESLKECLQMADILDKVVHSDHCPVYLKLEI
jgi:exodeoxyribonuclease-3